MSDVKTTVPNRAKQFVQRHKTSLVTAAIVIPTTIAVIQSHGIKSLNNFLREKDLFDEYYAVNEDE